MASRIRSAAFAASIAILAMAPVARSGRTLIAIRSADVTARADADTSIGRYLTLSYQLPAGVQASQIDHATLEIYLDVRSKSRDGYVNEAPVVEAFALREPFAGTVNLGVLDERTRSRRPVARGHAKRVLLDITGMVRAHLDHTLDNDGIILGSLTGMREGDFRLVSGRLPPPAVARVRIYTTPRNGATVHQSDR